MYMNDEKKLRPKLTPEGQIAHLKTKGVKFDICSEREAMSYLVMNNNYFKLRAYRKSFEKRVGGPKRDTYIDLDFAMLKDLAVIDMRLRYCLLLLSLDIEHFEKVKLLRIVSESDEDGYMIVAEYFSYLENLEEKNKVEGKASRPYLSLKTELERNNLSEYCGSLAKKYSENFPIWVFVEIISFGTFIDFLKFCANYLDEPCLKDDVYLLIDIKRIRNAAAHNSCIINNLSLNTAKHKTNYAVNRFLSKEVGISKDSRDRRMSNASVRDIVTLLYAHKHIVTSAGVSEAQKKNIEAVVKRCFKNIEYYRNHALIVATFDFLKKVVDKLYDL